MKPAVSLSPGVFETKLRFRVCQVYVLALCYMTADSSTLNRRKNVAIIQQVNPAALFLSSGCMERWLAMTLWYRATSKA
jgi:hypothetical protein